MPVTIKNISPGCFEVTVDESGASATSETTLEGMPTVGTVRRVQAQLISGTATGVAPILGRITDPAAAPATDLVVESATTASAAQRIDKCGSATYEAVEILNSKGVLYHRPRCNAGSNNVVRTVYHIKTGW